MSCIRVISLLFLLSTRLAVAWEPLPAQAPTPADNPLTEAKAELGKRLFFETQLSKTGEISCNSCHTVHTSGTDNKPVSMGIHRQLGGRNSPTVWNAAFWTVQFWDGRIASLEEQAKRPLINPVEMGMENHDAVVKRLVDLKTYGESFKKAFGDTAITIDRIAKAIASYERTLLTPDSAFDRYLKGDKTALNATALRGMALVKETGCTSCHSGPHFNGPVVPGGFYMKFPTIPGSEYEKKYELAKDLGRFVSTQNEADKNMWRVPSWRNVELTAPYFHNGKVETLEEAVRVMAKTQLAKDLKEVEVQDIVAFLKTLTGKKPI